MGRKKHSGAAGCITVLIVLVVLVGCAATLERKLGRKQPETAKEIVGDVAGRQIPYEEITIKETSLDDCFYYGQLDENGKTVYKEILQGIQENNEEIYLHCEDANTANDIFQSVMGDHPEVFWCEGNAVSVQYDATYFQEGYVLFRPVYAYEGSEKERRMDEIEAAAKECLSKIPVDASEYEKIKYVYEYLIRTVDYDLGAPDNQNIYSALVGKSSVCAGYAKSNQYLLEQLGIFCTYVTGTATDAEGNTEEHAWNIVKCDGEYYFVDVTWGDPIFRQEMKEKVADVMIYDYLCCSERELFRTHVLAEGYEYPQCRSESLNYYKMNGMYYDIFDEEQLLDAMYRSIDAGEASITFKMADHNVYLQVREAMTSGLLEQGAQYLGNKYYLWKVRYSYEEDAVLNKFSIYWYYE